MTLDLLKSLGYTALCIVLINLCSVWLCLEQQHDIYWFSGHFYFITGFFQIVIFLGFLSIVKGSSFITINQTKLVYYLIAIAIGLPFVFIQTPLNELYNYIFEDQHKIAYGLYLDQLLTFNQFALVTFIPIAEEFFSRKFIQGSVLKNTPAVLTIFLSALLFAVLHLDLASTMLFNTPLDIHHAYITFWGGLMAAILYYKSGSVGPAIMMHVCWNLGVVIF